MYLVQEDPAGWTRSALGTPHYDVELGGLMTFETLCMETGHGSQRRLCMYEGIFSIIIIGAAVSPALVITNISAVFAANGAITLLPILGCSSLPPCAPITSTCTL